MWGVGVFDSSLVPAVKPAYIDFAVDWRVIAYLVAITLATAVLFGLAPALQLSRLDINAALKQGGGVAGPGRGARLFSAVLVIAEVSLAVILLAAAGLMVRSLVNTSRAEIGVRAENVLSMEISLRRSKYPAVRGSRPVLRSAEGTHRGAARRRGVDGCVRPARRESGLVRLRSGRGGACSGARAYARGRSGRWRGLLPVDGGRASIGP